MRSNALFSLWNEVTSHPRKLPALRAEVASGAPSRRHAFILLLSVPSYTGVQPAHNGLHCWDGSGAAGAEIGAHKASLG